MIEYNPRETDIKYIKGVGEFRAKLFLNLDITSVNDLFEYFPREYMKREVNTPIRDLQAGQTASLKVKVFSVNEIITKKGLKQLKVVITDGDRFAECVWFNYGTWLTKLLVVGKEIWINGQMKEYQGNKSIQQPQILEISEDEDTTDFWRDRKILPIYNLTAKISQNIIRTTVFNAFALYHQGIDETLPDFIKKKYSFLDRKVALQKVHFSSNPSEIPTIKSRFVYEEFFYLQIMIAKNAKNRTEIIKYRKHVNNNILSKQLLDILPFTLTNAQKKVTREIFQDMVSDKPMNRLLQGDVGAGKTIVTLFAMLLAIENGYQTALLAPTEILAEQHFVTITKLLSNVDWKTPINICLIKGGKSKQKKTDKERIANGEINLAIGTHALFQKDVVFKNLSLFVVDEQHRFGVAQRAELSLRHNYPDLLYLSATPIPRSLAMTVFGEMSISSIDEMPPNRKPIKTNLLYENGRTRLYESLRTDLNKGCQIYIVCPLIEESEKVDLQAAETLYAELKTNVFQEYSIALIHGKKTSKEKEQIMDDFKNKDIQILVSTTVIEVGIDVANATIMIIEHAERFGLAQLHQLRGRVGRGAEQSYCYLIAYATGEIAKERLQTMVATNNGFEIAEKDLQLRGAGDMFGTLQSGLPEFKFANLVNDQNWLFAAKQDAFLIIDEDFDLKLEKHEIIRNYYEKYTVIKETLSNF